jgi:hypothetical protein
VIDPRSSPVLDPFPSRREIAELLNAFVSEAVASGPIGALRAGLAVWVIDAFIMRAPDNAICNYHGACVMLTEKVRDPLAGECVVADVCSFREPTLDQIGLTAFIRRVGDNDLRGKIRCRSVKGDGRDWIPSESAPGFLRQPRGCEA